MSARQCKESSCYTNNFQPCLDPPKAEWHDGQKRINETGKFQITYDSGMTKAQRIKVFNLRSIIRQNQDGVCITTHHKNE